MKPMKLHTRQGVDQAGRTYTLDYFMDIQRKDMLDHYGIVIEMTCGEVVETATQTCITPISHQAVELIEKLAKYQVTPAGLADVLQEIL